jgi:hypothetical protein
MEGHTIQRLKDSRKTIIYKSLHIKRYKAIQALFVTIKFFKEKHEQINYSKSHTITTQCLMPKLGFLMIWLQVLLYINSQYKYPDIIS